MKMMRNLITISETLGIEEHLQPLKPLTKNTKSNKIFLCRQMSSTVSKMMKETFGENKAIVIGDFAKDCQFFI